MARCSRDSPRANPRPMCPDQARGKKMRQNNFSFSSSALPPSTPMAGLVPILRVFRDGCGLCVYYMIGILRRECVRTGGTGKPASPTLCLKSGKGGALKVSWLFLTWEGGSNFPSYVAQLDSLFRLQLNLKFW